MFTFQILTEESHQNLTIYRVLETWCLWESKGKESKLWISLRSYQLPLGLAGRQNINPIEGKQVRTGDFGSDLRISAFDQSVLGF